MSDRNQSPFNQKNYVDDNTGVHIDDSGFRTQWPPGGDFYCFDDIRDSSSVDCSIYIVMYKKYNYGKWTCYHHKYDDKEEALTNYVMTIDCHDPELYPPWVFQICLKEITWASSKIIRRYNYHHENHEK